MYSQSSFRYHHSYIHELLRYSWIALSASKSCLLVLPQVCAHIYTYHHRFLAEAFRVILSHFGYWSIWMHGADSKIRNSNIPWRTHSTYTMASCKCTVQCIALLNKSNGFVQNVMLCSMNSMVSCKMYCFAEWIQWFLVQCIVLLNKSNDFMPNV